ncbi:MAG TPA: hypothetical protein VEZ90_08810 [Blastocatellia bacterium]|nr:hypothetical protein [Blastocatellia bacterium]
MSPLGVPEVWRYDGRALTFYVLAEDEYVESVESKALPGLKKETVSRLIESSKHTRRSEWVREIRKVVPW